LLKKIVVLFPDSQGRSNKRTFETACEEEYLEVNNTDKGCLVIRCDADLPKYTPITLAVFKDWIYWERVNE